MLAALGAPAAGFDVPAVGAPWEHILIGLAVAMLTYTEQPDTG